MHKIFVPSALLLFALTSAHAQTVTGKLQFEQGKKLVVTVDQQSTIVQEAMGQTIDFKTNATTIHSYKITNATTDNATLHHEVNRFSFNFDGMGSKQSFDSDNKKDMGSDIGKSVSDMLSKTYDIIVDGYGKTLLAKPEKTEFNPSSDKAAMIMASVKEMTDIVKPPAKGTNSFFKILPDGESAVGSTWRDSVLTENERSVSLYTLSAITDSTIVIDFKTSAATTTTAEAMGMETVTKLNTLSNGQIILNRSTGILKQKTTQAESSGTTEIMNNSLPITAKSTIVQTVRSE